MPGPTEPKKVDYIGMLLSGVTPDDMLNYSDDNVEFTLPSYEETAGKYADKVGGKEEFDKLYKASVEQLGVIKDLRATGYHKNDPQGATRGGAVNIWSVHSRPSAPTPGAMTQQDTSGEMYLGGIGKGTYGKGQVRSYEQAMWNAAPLYNKDLKAIDKKGGAFAYGKDRVAFKQNPLTGDAYMQVVDPFDENTRKEHLMSYFGPSGMYSNSLTSVIQGATSAVSNVVAGITGTVPEMAADWMSEIYTELSPDKKKAAESYKNSWIKRGLVGYQEALQGFTHRNEDQKGGIFSDTDAFTAIVADGVAQLTTQATLNRVAGGTMLKYGFSPAVSARFARSVAIGAGSATVMNHFKREAAQAGIEDERLVNIMTMAAGMATWMTEGALAPDAIVNYFGRKMGQGLLKKVIQEEFGNLSAQQLKQLNREQTESLLKKYYTRLMDGIAKASFRAEKTIAGAGVKAAISEGAQEVSEGILHTGIKGTHDYLKSLFDSDSLHRAGYFGVDLFDTRSYTEDMGENFWAGFFSGGIGGAGSSYASGYFRQANKERMLANYIVEGREAEVLEMLDEMYQNKELGFDHRDEQGNLITPELMQQYEQQGKPLRTLNDRAYENLKTEIQLMTELYKKHGINNPEYMQKITGGDKTLTKEYFNLLVQRQRIQGEIAELKGGSFEQPDPKTAPQEDPKKKASLEFLEKEIQALDETIQTYESGKVYSDRLKTAKIQNYHQAGGNITENVVPKDFHDATLLVKAIDEWNAQMPIFSQRFREQEKNFNDSIKSDRDAWMAEMNEVSANLESIFEKRKEDPAGIDGLRALIERANNIGFTSTEVPAVKAFQQLYQDAALKILSQEMDENDQAAFQSQVEEQGMSDLQALTGIDKFRDIAPTLSFMDENPLSGIKPLEEMSSKEKVQKDYYDVFSYDPAAENFSYVTLDQKISELENTELGDESIATLLEDLRKIAHNLAYNAATNKKAYEGISDEHTYFQDIHKLSDETYQDILQRYQSHLNRIDQLIKNNKLASEERKSHDKKIAIEDLKLRNWVAESLYQVMASDLPEDQRKKGAEIKEKLEKALKPVFEKGVASSQEEFDSLMASVEKMESFLHKNITEKHITDTKKHLFASIPTVKHSSYVQPWEFSRANFEDIFSFNGIVKRDFDHSPSDNLAMVYVTNQLENIKRLDNEVFQQAVSGYLAGKTKADKIPTYQQLRAAYHIVAFLSAEPSSHISKTADIVGSLEPTDRILLNSLMVRGFAGTGKTSMVAGLAVELLGRIQGKKVHAELVAPSAETLDALSSSINPDYVSVLGEHVDKTQEGNIASLKLDEATKVVIYDESSMVDESALQELRSKEASSNVKYLFLGDTSQMGPSTALETQLFSPIEMSMERTLPITIIHRTGIADLWTLQASFRRSILLGEKAKHAPVNLTYNEQRTLGGEYVKNTSQGIAKMNSAFLADLEQGREAIMIVYDDTQRDKVLGELKALARVNPSLLESSVLTASKGPHVASGMQRNKVYVRFLIEDATGSRQFYKAMLTAVSRAGDPATGEGYVMLIDNNGVSTQGDPLNLGAAVNEQDNQARLDSLRFVAEKVIGKEKVRKEQDKEEERSTRSSQEDDFVSLAEEFVNARREALEKNISFSKETHSFTLKGVTAPALQSVTSIMRDAQQKDQGLGDAFKMIRGELNHRILQLAIANSPHKASIGSLVITEELQQQLWSEFAEDYNRAAEEFNQEKKQGRHENKKPAQKFVFAEKGGINFRQYLVNIATQADQIIREIHQSASNSYLVSESIVYNALLRQTGVAGIADIIQITGFNTNGNPVVRLYDLKNIFGVFSKEEFYKDQPIHGSLVGDREQYNRFEDVSRQLSAYKHLAENHDETMELFNMQVEKDPDDNNMPYLTAIVLSQSLDGKIIKYNQKDHWVRARYDETFVKNNLYEKAREKTKKKKTRKQDGSTSYPVIIEKTENKEAGIKREDIVRNRPGRHYVVNRVYSEQLDQDSPVTEYIELADFDGELLTLTEKQFSTEFVKSDYSKKEWEEEYRKDRQKPGDVRRKSMALSYESGYLAGMTPVLYEQAAKGMDAFSNPLQRARMKMLAYMMTQANPSVEIVFSSVPLNKVRKAANIPEYTLLMKWRTLPKAVIEDLKQDEELSKVLQGDFSIESLKKAGIDVAGVIAQPYADFSNTPVDDGFTLKDYADKGKYLKLKDQIARGAFKDDRYGAQLIRFNQDLLTMRHKIAVAAIASKEKAPVEISLGEADISKDFFLQGMWETGPEQSFVDFKAKMLDRGVNITFSDTIIQRRFGNKTTLAIQYSFIDRFAEPGVDLEKSDPFNMGWIFLSTPKIDFADSKNTYVQKIKDSIKELKKKGSNLSFQDITSSYAYKTLQFNRSHLIGSELLKLIQAKHPGFEFSESFLNLGRRDTKETLKGLKDRIRMLEGAYQVIQGNASISDLNAMSGVKIKGNIVMLDEQSTDISELTTNLYDLHFPLIFADTEEVSSLAGESAAEEDPDTHIPDNLPEGFDSRKGPRRRKKTREEEEDNFSLQDSVSQSDEHIEENQKEGISEEDNSLVESIRLEVSQENLVYKLLNIYGTSARLNNVLRFVMPSFRKTYFDPSPDKIPSDIRSTVEKMQDSYYENYQKKAPRTLEAQQAEIQLFKTVNQHNFDEVLDSRELRERFIFWSLGSPDLNVLPMLIKYKIPGFDLIEYKVDKRTQDSIQTKNAAITNVFSSASEMLKFHLSSVTARRFGIRKGRVVNLGKDFNVYTSEKMLDEALFRASLLAREKIRPGQKNMTLEQRWVDNLIELAKGYAMERTLEEGSYVLSDEGSAILSLVYEYFNYTDDSGHILSQDLYRVHDNRFQKAGQQDGVMSYFQVHSQREENQDPSRYFSQQLSSSVMSVFVSNYMSQNSTPYSETRVSYDGKGNKVYTVSVKNEQNVSNLKNRIQQKIKHTLFDINNGVLQLKETFITKALGAFYNGKQDRPTMLNLVEKDNEAMIVNVRDQNSPIATVRVLETGALRFELSPAIRNVYDLREVTSIFGLRDISNATFNAIIKGAKSIEGTSMTSEKLAELLIYMYVSAKEFHAPGSFKLFDVNSHPAFKAVKPSSDFVILEGDDYQDLTDEDRERMRESTAMKKPYDYFGLINDLATAQQYSKNLKDKNFVYLESMKNRIYTRTPESMMGRVLDSSDDALKHYTDQIEDGIVKALNPFARNRERWTVNGKARPFIGEIFYKKGVQYGKLSTSDYMKHVLNAFVSNLLTPGNKTYTMPYHITGKSNQWEYNVTLPDELVRFNKNKELEVNRPMLYKELANIFQIQADHQEQSVARWIEMLSSIGAIDKSEIEYFTDLNNYQDSKYTGEAQNPVREKIEFLKANDPARLIQLIDKIRSSPGFVENRDYVFTEEGIAPGNATEFAGHPIFNIYNYRRLKQTPIQEHEDLFRRMTYGMLMRWQGPNGKLKELGISVQELLRGKKVFKDTRENKDSDVLSRPGKDPKGMREFHPAMEAFYLMHMITDYHMTHLTMGSPVQYQDMTELVKRSNMTVSPSQRGDTSSPFGIPQTVNYAILEDEFILDESTGEEVAKTDGLTLIPMFFASQIHHSMGGENSNYDLRGMIKPLITQVDPSKGEARQVKTAFMQITPLLFESSEYYRHLFLNVILKGKARSLFLKIYNDNNQDFALANQEFYRELTLDPSLNNDVHHFLPYASAVKTGISGVKNVRNPEGTLALMGEGAATQQVSGQEIRLQLEANQEADEEAVATVSKQIIAQMGIGKHNQKRFEALQDVFEEIAIEETDKIFDTLVSKESDFDRKKILLQLRRYLMRNVGKRSDLNALSEMLSNPNISVQLPFILATAKHVFGNDIKNRAIKFDLPGERVTQAPGDELELITTSSGKTILKKDYTEQDRDSLPVTLGLRGMRRENGVLQPADAVVPYTLFSHYGASREVPLHHMFNLVFTDGTIFNVQGMSPEELRALLLDKKNNRADIDYDNSPGASWMMNKLKEDYLVRAEKGMLDNPEVFSSEEDQETYRTESQAIAEKFKTHLFDSVVDAGEGNYQDPDAPQGLDTLGAFNDFTYANTAEVLINYFTSFDKSLTLFVPRTPAGSPAAGTIAKVIGFSDPRYDGSTFYTSSKKNTRDGTDYDIDQLTLYYIRKPDNYLQRNTSQQELLEAQRAERIMDLISGYYQDEQNDKFVFSTLNMKEYRELSTQRKKTYLHDASSHANTYQEAMLSEGLIGIFALAGKTFNLIQAAQNISGGKVFKNNLLPETDEKGNPVIVNNGKNISAAVDNIKLMLLGGLNINLSSGALFTALTNAGYSVERATNILKLPSVRRVISKVENSRSIDSKKESLLDEVRRALGVFRSKKTSAQENWKTKADYTREDIEKTQKRMEELLLSYNSNPDNVSEEDRMELFRYYNFSETFNGEAENEVNDAIAEVMMEEGRLQDPRIEQTAEEIARGMQDPMEEAKRFRSYMDWIDQNLEALTLVEQHALLAQAINQIMPIVRIDNNGFGTNDHDIYRLIEDTEFALNMPLEDFLDGKEPSDPEWFMTKRVNMKESEKEQFIEDQKQIRKMINVKEMVSSLSALSQYLYNLRDLKMMYSQIAINHPSVHRAMDDFLADAGRDRFEYANQYVEYINQVQKFFASMFFNKHYRNPLHLPVFDNAVLDNYDVSTPQGRNKLGDMMPQIFLQMQASEDPVVKRAFENNAFLKALEVDTKDNLTFIKINVPEGEISPLELERLQRGFNALNQDLPGYRMKEAFRVYDFITNINKRRPLSEVVDHEMKEKYSRFLDGELMNILNNPTKEFDFYDNGKVVKRSFMQMAKDFNQDVHLFTESLTLNYTREMKRKETPAYYKGKKFISTPSGDSITRNVLRKKLDETEEALMDQELQKGTSDKNTSIYDYDKIIVTPYSKLYISYSPVSSVSLVEYTPVQEEKHTQRKIARPSMSAAFNILNGYRTDIPFAQGIFDYNSSDKVVLPYDHISSEGRPITVNRRQRKITVNNISISTQSVVPPIEKDPYKERDLYSFDNQEELLLKLQGSSSPTHAYLAGILIGASSHNKPGLSNKVVWTSLSDGDIGRYHWKTDSKNNIEEGEIHVDPMQSTHQIEQTFLHEYLHKVSVYPLLTGKATSKHERDFVKNIDLLFKATNDALKSSTLLKEIGLTKEQVKDFRENGFLKNRREFVAELGNSDVQDILIKVRLEKNIIKSDSPFKTITNVFEEFLRIFTEYLHGITGGRFTKEELDKTVLKEAIYHTMRYVHERRGKPVKDSETSEKGYESRKAEKENLSGYTDPLQKLRDGLNTGRIKYASGAVNASAEQAMYNAVMNSAKENRYKKGEYVYHNSDGVYRLKNLSHDEVLRVVREEILPDKHRWELKIKEGTIEWLNRGGTPEAGEAVFRDAQGRSRFDEPTLNKLLSATGFDSSRGDKAMSYEEFKQSYPQYAAENLRGENPMVIVHGKTNDPKIEENKAGIEVSILDVTTKDLTPGKESLLSPMVSTAMATDAGSTLTASEQGIRHLQLMITMMEMKKKNPGVRFVQTGLLAPRKSEVNLSMKSYQNEEIPALRKLIESSEDLKKALGEDIVELFMDESLKEAVYGNSYIYQIQNLYEHQSKGDRATRKGTMAEKAQEYMSNKGNAQELEEMISARLLQIEKRSRYIDNPDEKFQDNEYIMLSGALKELSHVKKTHKSPVYKMNFLDQYLTMPNFVSNDVLQWIEGIVHESLFKIQKKAFDFKQAFNIQAEKLNKEYFKRFPEDYGKEVVLDISEKRFKRLFKKESYIDENNNQVFYNSGKIYFAVKNAQGEWVIEDPETQQAIDSGQLSMTEAVFGGYIVETIREQMIQNFIHDMQHESNYSITSEEDRQKLQERARERYVQSWQDGMIPVMSKPASRALMKLLMGKKEGVSVGKFYDKLMNRFTEDAVIFQDNYQQMGTSSKQERTYSLPKYMMDQVGSLQGFGSSSRLEQMGLSYDEATARATLVDREANDDMSEDLEIIMTYFMLGSIRKNEMEKNVLPKLNAAKALLWQMEKYQGKNMHHAQEWLRQWKDRLIFRETGKLGHLGKVNMDAMTNMLISGASMSMIGFSVPTAVSSALYNAFGLFSASVSNSASANGFFSAKSMRKALKLYVTDKGYRKMEGLINLYQVTHMDERSLAISPQHKKTGKKFLFQSHWFHWMNFITDYHARGLVMVAQMIEDGSYDAHVVDENGEVRYEETLDKRFEAADGKLIRDKIYQENVKAGIQDKENEKLTIAYDIRSMRNLKDLADRELGGYDPETYNNLQATVLGRFFMVFRKYMPVKIANAFLKPQYREVSGRWVTSEDENGNKEVVWQPEYYEGKYMTLWYVAQHAGELLKSPAEFYTKMEPRQKTNLNRLLIDAALFAVLYAALSGAWDDEEEKGKKMVFGKLLGSSRLFMSLNYAMMDVVNDMNPMFYLETVKNPFIVASYLDRIASLGNAMISMDASVGEKALKVLPGGATASMVMDMVEEEK